MQNMQKKIIIITAGFIAICFALFLILKPSTPKADHQVFDFAHEIILQHRLKNDYSGLAIQKENLFAGAENQTQLGFGAKSFFITAHNVDKNTCTSLLMADNKKDLSLIAIKINKKEFSWGNGLPLSQKDTANECQESNTLVWVFS